MSVRIKKPPAATAETWKLLAGSLGIFICLGLVVMATVSPSTPNITPEGTQSVAGMPPSAPVMADAQGPGMPPTHPSVDPALAAHLNTKRQAVEKSPRQLSPLLDLGNTYFDMGRYAEAADVYYQVTLLAPRNVNILTDLGTSLFYIGLSHLALDYYQKALNVKKDHAQAYFNMGVVFASLKQKPKAREMFLKAQSLAPNPMAKRQIGEAIKALESASATPTMP